MKKAFTWMNNHGIEYTFFDYKKDILLEDKFNYWLGKLPLEQIVNKGRGAYYSSGSRPNQTAESWGLARLASAVTGGNASIVDYHILKSGCKKTSKALKLANKTCKKQGKCNTSE